MLLKLTYMTESSGSILGLRLQFIHLWIRGESKDQNTAIWAKVRSRWYATNMMCQDEVAGRHHCHTFGLLVDIVGVGSDFLDQTRSFNVGIIQLTIAFVMKTGEDLHEWEVKDTRGLHRRNLVGTHTL